jgi:hypothetical protein
MLECSRQTNQAYWGCLFSGRLPMYCSKASIINMTLATATKADERTRFLAWFTSMKV